MCILWDGGVTPCVYADNRHGGRVIVDLPDEGVQLMNRSEFGKHALRGGEGAPWGTPLEQEYDRLLKLGLVDDTTSVEPKEQK